MVCLICGEQKHRYLRMLNEAPLWQCAGCGLIASAAPSSDGKARRVERGNSGNELIWSQGKTVTDASKRYVHILNARTAGREKIILVAPPNHAFHRIALESGWRSVLSLSVADLEHRDLARESADAVVLLYQLERSAAADRALRRAHRLLRPGGIILVVTPSLDSRSARFFGDSWTEWRPDNRYYFDNTTIQSLLLRYGFNEVELRKDLRRYTLEHIYERARDFPRTWPTRAVRLLYHLVPGVFRNLYFRLPSSGIVVTAKKTMLREHPLLSIVVPVYNESATFQTLMSQLVAKQIRGVDKEVILVESNSTDNSRDLVMGYKDQAGVRVILQDQPRGKGNAVRAGLQQAKGDVIMIQDADLEYDLNDYESLLEPVLGYKRPFVLGSRHGGSWKMRHFNDQEGLATYFNVGHLFFTGLLNLLYGQSMKDPFTMFKVFRGDCLHNLKFECDRFDFDFELVIKLIRKGYTPLEIPVNYYSRSFREGKKVNAFRDPLTWLKAAFKYRFVSIYTTQDG